MDLFLAESNPMQNNGKQQSGFQHIFLSLYAHIKTFVI